MSWVDGYGKTPSEKTQQFIFLKPLLMQQFFPVGGWAVHLENIHKSNFVISPQIGVKITKIKTTTYCWWLKSCTTGEVWNPVDTGTFTKRTDPSIHRETFSAKNSPGPQHSHRFQILQEGGNYYVKNGAVNVGSFVQRCPKFTRWAPL